MPLRNPLGGATNVGTIDVPQAVLDSLERPGSGFFAGTHVGDYNVGKAARELAPALAAIALALPTGGSSIITYALNESLSKAATGSDFLAENLGAVKLGITAAKLFSGDLTRTEIGGNVGFFDDIFGSADSIGDNFSSGLSSTSFDYGALLNTGVGLANRFLAPRNNNNSSSIMMPPQLTSATLPAVIGAGGMVVRGAMTALAARLAAVGLTRASAWSLLKSQGPTALLALGLTAAEVVTVARKGSGRRRMNMCNGRALRRAQRRLTSFHNFYKKTCGMPSVRHRKKSCK